MGRNLSYSERKKRVEMFQQGMLWCSDCKLFQPVKDFGKTKHNSSNYGYLWYCRRCKAIRDHDSYKRNNGHTAHYGALKAKFVELAGGCCQRCGYRDFCSALSFHHIYRSQKKHNPQTIINSGNFEKAWKELDKCCLLCMNCHIAYGAGLWRAEFTKRDGLGFTIGTELPLDDKRYETDKPPAYNQASMPLFNYQQKNLQLALFDQPATYAAGVTQ